MCLPAILVKRSSPQLNHLFRALHELLHSKFLQKEVTCRTKGANRTAASKKSWMRSKTIRNSTPNFRLYCKRFIMLIHRSQSRVKTKSHLNKFFLLQPSKKFQSWNFFVRFHKQLHTNITSRKKTRVKNNRTFYFLHFNAMTPKLFGGLQQKRETVNMRILRQRVYCVIIWFSSMVMRLNRMNLH